MRTKAVLGESQGLATRLAGGLSDARGHQANDLASMASKPQRRRAVPGARGAQPANGPAEPGTAEQLRERVKELTCLYRVVAAFNEHQASVRECFRRIAEVLPQACRVPERTFAAVRLDEVEERSPGFQPTPLRLECELRVAGRRRGVLTLVQREVPGDSSNGFLPEERSLLETVAQQIGAFVERLEGERARAGMELQLRHADRLATIGQLAAGVAHELNEPLGNVLGFAQLAQRAEGLPEQVRADLARIVEASLRGREIVRKLLVFARQAPASKHSVSVNSVVEESMFLLEAGCENPRVRFVRDLAADLPAIEADPVQVRQVITNLVINAMQAIEGQGLITVRTRAEPGVVAMIVEDTGVGMTAEVARHAFDPFFTTKDVGQGTGLGLSVVEGIVAGHGGTVEVESEPGRGSTFRVRLPAPTP